MATPAAVLQILVTADTDRARRQVADLDRSLGSADKSGSRMGSTMKKVGAVVGGIVAFDTLRRGVSAAVGEFEEARKVGAQTEAVIKSTGGAAGVTAKHVANLAGAISKKVGIDDEAIQSGANLLLTFKNVRNEVGRGNKVFDRATKAAVDLSAAGFGDLSATSKQLGKALNDPIKGLTALSRSGVTFTQQQQEKIKSLVEEGKTLKAQKIILKEVESQVKGSAAAQATSLDKAKVALGNLAEAGGAVLVPALDTAARVLTKLVNGMIEGKGAGGALISVFRTTGTVFGEVIGAIAGVVGWFRQHETVTLALAAAVGVLVTAFTAMKILVVVQAAVIALRGAMLALNAAFLTNPVFLLVAALAALAAGVVVAYRESETFRKIIDGAWKVTKAVAAWLITAGTAAFQKVRDVVKSAWTAVRDVTQAVWNNGVKQFLSGVFDALRTLVRTYFEIYKTIITGAWRAIKIATETVWGVIKTVATGAWTGLRTAATTMWDGIKTAILTPIRAARDIIGGKDGIWAQIKDVAGAAWGGIKTAIKKAADPILDVILAPFKAAVRGVAKFAKLILQVVGKIPGVNTDGPVKAIDKFTEGLAKGGVYQAFARGGAYARTGGVVSAPITLMGEEAPRHPEFVIPTNPAYRKRAKGLLARAAGVIGFAKGGKYDRDYGAGNPATIPFEAAAQLAEAAGLPGITYAQIAIGESGLRPGAVSNDGGYGLWQMTPRVQSQETRLAWQRIGSFFNPWHNAQMAKVLAGSGTGVSNYYGTSHVTDWNKHYTGSTEGYVPHGFAQGAPSLNPLDLIKKLPGVGDLPGWLGGFGKWTLGQVGKFIKDQIGKVAGGILGGAVPGWGVIDRMAKSFGMTITDTYRPGGTTYHGQMLGVSGRARATDYSNGTAPTAEMMAFAKKLKAEYGSQLKELFYSPLGGSVKNNKWVPGMIVGGGLGTPGNHYNHVHVAFRKGGKYGGLPFVGSYAQGGVVPRTGMAMVHRGETVTPAGAGTVLYATLDLGRGIRERLRLEFDEHGRQTSAAFRVGLVST